jgi:prevent-host-death family protein
MKQVSREEAVATIAELLDEAAHGQDVLVTDRGKPVVRLSAVAGSRAMRTLTPEEIEELFARVQENRSEMIRRGVKPFSLSEIRALIDEGRR